MQKKQWIAIDFLWKKLIRQLKVFQLIQYW